MTISLELRSNGHPVDTSSAAFGDLRRSSDALADVEELRRRMAEDGYLFLPGFFDPAHVLEVRRSFTDALSAEGMLDPSEDPIKAIARADVEMYFRPDLARKNPVVENLVYGERIMGFFDTFLGGPARHYDYTWVRAVAHGLGTCPHCDIVYMGRGTTNLYTAWTPLGDIPLHVGGLIVLENSHKQTALKETYGTLDVDSMCSNSDAGRNILEARGYHESGAITLDPPALREKLGGRWLTAEYKLGDLLIFSMFTVHGSLDNQSPEIRMSTDTRYQLASEPIDERWIGDDQIAHGANGKKNLIC